MEEGRKEKIYNVFRLTTRGRQQQKQRRQWRRRLVIIRLLNY